MGISHLSFRPRSWTAIQYPAGEVLEKLLQACLWCTNNEPAQDQGIGPTEGTLSIARVCI